MIEHGRLSASPITPVVVDNHHILVKRDDLLGEYFSGNKARKFAYFLSHDFTNINTLVAYGSLQANSLYSLAALARIKKWQFHYYVSHIPQYIRENPPSGNYGGALALGAEVFEASTIDNNLEQYMLKMARQLPEEHLFIEEGGRCEYAQWGIAQLAQELHHYCLQHCFSAANIYLPAGTGTTALYLQQALLAYGDIKFQVFTCTCVGNDDYLRAQFSQLVAEPAHWPQILTQKKKYHFGKLYLEHYQRWLALKQQTSIEFDLLYDPLGWQMMLAHLAQQKSETPAIYIHQGGVKGNETMLPRYQRKYPHCMQT